MGSLAWLATAQDDDGAEISRARLRGLSRGHVVEGASDTSLLQAIGEGNVDAFERLHARYANSLYQFALRYTGDPAQSADIVQDTFVRFWQQRATVRPHTSLRAYLFQSVRNAALNAIRDGRRRDWLSHDPAFVAGEQDSTVTTDAALEAEEERARVIAAVRTLPPRTREAIVLRWAHGLSYAEIAVAMGVSVETVKSQLARGLALLREKL